MDVRRPLEVNLAILGAAEVRCKSNEVKGERGTSRLSDEPSGRPIEADGRDEERGRDHHGPP